MTKPEKDRRVIQYLWDKLGSRTSDITTFVPRGMVDELLHLLSQQGTASPEDAVIAYLENMTQRNNGEYEGTEGNRFGFPCNLVVIGPRVNLVSESTDLSSAVSKL